MNSAVDRSKPVVMLAPCLLILLATLPTTRVMAQAPNIFAQPQPVVVSPGNPASFSVGASSPTPLGYQWRLNQLELQDETNTFLSIPFCDITNGGTYDVVITNNAGVVVSTQAFLLFDTTSVPWVPAPNAFSTRFNLGPTPNGQVQGTNAAANLEFGEPRHAGKTGGASVWYSWTAPYNCWATFSTAGSTFDTLLGVYQGALITALSPVAGDDDSGGFWTSHVGFYATAGTNYQIAVDGYAGAKGFFLLGWYAQPVPVAPPFIFAQPANITIHPGATATFCVQANGNGPLGFQWFHDGVPVFGANSPVFQITNSQPLDLGFYQVCIVDLFNFLTNYSIPAELQFGSDSGNRAQRKLIDLAYGCAAQNSNCHFADLRGPRPLNGLPSCYNSVSAGVPGYQMFQNPGSSSTKYPCSTLTSTAMWLGLTPAQDGFLEVDTLGSTTASGAIMDTWLAVFRDGTNPTPSKLVFVACNDDISPSLATSRLKIPVSGGTNYTIMVDGLRDSTGTLLVNWFLGLPPTIQTQPASLRLVQNQTARFNVTASGTPALSYQWQFNGTNISGAIATNLVLPAITFSNQGPYHVVITNPCGIVISTDATLTVEAPVLLSLIQQTTPNLVQFHLQGATMAGWVIQGSTNLISQSNWIPLYTNNLPNGSFTNLDFTDVVFSNSWLYSRRFYRTITWP